MYKVSSLGRYLLLEWGWGTLSGPKLQKGAWHSNQCKRQPCPKPNVPAYCTMTGAPLVRAATQSSLAHRGWRGTGHEVCGVMGLWCSLAWYRHAKVDGLSHPLIAQLAGLGAEGTCPQNIQSQLLNKFASRVDPCRLIQRIEKDGAQVDVSIKPLPFALFIFSKFYKFEGHWNS